jgi:hypothetical protein
VVYAAAGGSSSGEAGSSTGTSGVASGSTAPSSSEKVAGADTADDDEPAQGSHLTDEQVLILSANGYPMQRIMAADEALAAGASQDEFLSALGHPQPEEGETPKAPALTLGVKTPDEVVIGFAATTEPVLRPYIVRGGAVVSLTGHLVGAGTGVALVADPDPGASKALGYYMIVVNTDGAIADVRTLTSGVPTPTLLNSAVREGLINAGVDEGEAGRAAALVEMTSNGVQAYKIAIIFPAGLTTGSPTEPVAPESVNPGKLTFDPATKSWTSNGGLVYEQGSAQGNRVLHVLDHLSPNPAKPLHTLFNVDRTQLVGLIDEAWAARQGAGVLQANGNRVFDVAMGRAVGAGGETTIRIVVRDGTTKVITAYPIP